MKFLSLFDIKKINVLELFFFLVRREQRGYIVVVAASGCLWDKGGNDGTKRLTVSGE